ncbi:MULTISPECIES: gluconate 2-dehydrogenase subunit 3 family protein [unclassified Mucilaginibacter]|uniref:gluconate 2-dehydrogenase subunit 3 family protein n=1 Tax=unclassified Mucilaginibacter TaxID=2617802 RepID=UPI0009616CB5|nr:MULTISPECIES: gluconate 2-dehydrogenase subunit 3 family protein [unclassified Mucilaginibacter]OJW16984.1 MAG: twin-arginine translocation pathway signal protein [Mucilaginibacter sp. 44-25]PLW88663.1 MAG: twin-arginine translocation pathway signal protein [Mucilaginibacter sp.]HEK21636.1 gluconate 2-dehydrogenase subunit 3 family protein [Bacteroidota bacterium]
MNRRDAISRVGLILGGAVIGAEFFVSGCKSGGSVNTDDLFSKETTAYMNEIGETILPATSTPGAKAANVGGFMAIMVRDCYTDADQKVFKKGLAQLDEACDKKFNKKFMDADAKQRTELLTQLDKEAKDYAKTKKPEDPNHYFSMIKQLTLLGYFTSEVGATKALRYVPVPGKYIGDYPYKKGDKAWALS